MGCSPTRPRSVVDRPCGGARSRRARCREPGPGGPARGRPAAGLCLGGGAQLDREGMHDPRTGPGGRGPRLDGRRVPDANRRARGGDRGRSCRRVPADRDRGDPRLDGFDVRRSRRRDRPDRGRHGLWLHVDAAYAGVVALLPDRRGPFAGWERADSIVVNPHKWLFTPFDASLLLTRQMPPAARRVQPRAGVPPDPGSDDPGPRHERVHTPVLGRRFRALKLWVCCAGSAWRGSAGGSRTTSRWRRSSPPGSTRTRTSSASLPCPFSTVCLRWRPGALVGHEAESELATMLDARNRRLMDAVNRTGRGASCPTLDCTAGSRSESRSATSGPRTSSSPGVGPAAARGGGARVVRARPRASIGRACARQAADLGARHTIQTVPPIDELIRIEPDLPRPPRAPGHLHDRACCSRSPRR